MEISKRRRHGSFILGTSGSAPVLPVNTVAPVISGATLIGSVLSCTTGTWLNAPLGYLYQWYKGGVAITDQTDNTYTSVIGDVGANITCRVRAYNGAGTAVAVESNAIVPTAPPVPVNSVAPVISGAAVVGSLLSSTTGTWSNSPTGYTYQWYRGASPIGSATNNTYTTQAADIGTSVTCRVTASNLGGSGTPTASNGITVLPMVPVNTVAPAVTGATVFGSLLTCSTGTWTNTPSGYTYRWYKNGVFISGQTANTYTTVVGDVGADITCGVIASNAGGSGVEAESNAVNVTSVSYLSNVVLTQSGDTLTAAFDVLVSEQNKKPELDRVVVTGTLMKTNVLTATASGFFSPSDYPAAATEYRWYRCTGAADDGTLIAGATASTYTLVDADVTKRIRVEARAVQTGGLNTTGDWISSIITGAIADNVFNPVTDIAWETALLPSGASNIAANGWVSSGALAGMDCLPDGANPQPTFNGTENAVEFTGASSQRLLFKQASPQSAFPLEVWVRVKHKTHPGGWSYPLAFTSNQRMESRTAGALYISGAASGFSMALNTWKVVRFVISGVANTTKCNMNNGTEVTTLNSSTSLLGTGNGRIGSSSPGTGNYYDGYISHIFRKSGELSAPNVANMWSWFQTNAPYA